MTWPFPNHRQALYLEVVDDLSEATYGFVKPGDFFVIPRAGDYVELYDTANAQVRGILFSKSHQCVSIDLFPHRVHDIADAVSILREEGWIEADQHGDPVEPTEFPEADVEDVEAVEDDLVDAPEPVV